MALFLPYVPLLLAFVSCPERSIDWSRERLLLLLLSKNKSWKYGWRTFFIVYSKLDFRYWGTLPCYQFTILFAEHNLLQLAYSAFSTTNLRKRNVRFWRKKSHLDNVHNCSFLKEQQFLCNMSCFLFWLEEWLLHAILEEYFLEAFSSWVPFLPEQFRFYSLDKEDNAKTIRTGLGRTWNMSQVALGLG